MVGDSGEGGQRLPSTASWGSCGLLDVKSGTLGGHLAHALALECQPVRVVRLRLLPVFERTSIWYCSSDPRSQTKVSNQFPQLDCPDYALRPSRDQ